MAVRQLTKEQRLQLELEAAQHEVVECKKQLKALERYKQYEEAAGEIRALFMSLVDQGFSEDQAMKLLETLFTSFLPGLIQK